MRILMFDNEFPPLGGGTGVINYHVLEECTSYEDIWIDLITSSRSRNSYETERFAERITIYKVPVDNSNIHHSSNHELIRYSWRGLKLSRNLLKQHHYDLSFAFAGVPAGAISYALSRTTNLPYLVSLQGPDVPGFESRYDYLYPFLKPLLRRIWHRATVVTASSREHQRLALRTAPDLEIPIVYNGVDLEKFHALRSPRQNGGISVLCVGRLIERKGQQHLLSALSLLRQEGFPVKLNLVGTGDAESSLHCLAKELGVSKAVTFSGFVPRNEMPAVYRQADLFVLPSQNEGMSVALLEALASGLPVVVVANAGGTAELVQEGKNGYTVSWGDVSALATAIKKLTRDKYARLHMGNKSRQIAEQFSWSNVANEYLTLCEQIIKQDMRALAPA